MALCVKRGLLAASAAALVISPLSAQVPAAQSQAYPDQPPPPPPSDQQSDQHGQYDQRPANADQDRYGPPPPPPVERVEDLPPPPDYDGTRPPPPPPGYEPTADEEAQRAGDDAYAARAERWARDYCVKARDNTATGAIIGSIVGAIIGSGASGHHDRGGGTLAGAAIGAVGGAVIGSTSANETSPGCPPGYVIRREAPEYTYSADYYYAAPGWYRPWVYVGREWVYRPYPYHNWYYRHYQPYRGYGGYGGGRGYWHGDGRHDHRH